MKLNSCIKVGFKRRAIIKSSSLKVHAVGLGKEFYSEEKNTNGP